MYYIHIYNKYIFVILYTTNIFKYFIYNKYIFFILTKNFQMSNCIWKTQSSNCQHLLYHRKSKGIAENICFCFFDYTKAFECLDHKKKTVENS